MQAEKANAQGGNLRRSSCDDALRRDDYNPYGRITRKEKLMAWAMLYGWVLLMAALDWANRGFEMAW
jgi:hypothetical protein